MGQHYDEQTHTEQTHTIINVPELPRSRGYSDSTIKIRYMNKFNLPDSMVILSKDGNLTYYNKSVYTYDKKHRNIFTEYFFKSDTVFWKTATLKAEYKKNNIIYTQTPEKQLTIGDDTIEYQASKALFPDIKIIIKTSEPTTDGKEKKQ